MPLSLVVKLNQLNNSLFSLYLKKTIVKCSTDTDLNSKSIVMQKKLRASLQ